MSEFVEIKIHGQLFRMRAKDGGGDLQRIARHVDEVISQMARHFSKEPGHRVAIMAAMQIADALFQESARREMAGLGQAETRKIEESLTRLIAESDRVLGTTA
ncbi:MAG: cell division protein ZapA [Magnetococcales bacterium]|nr:cell division protein ZapA [Magnetococcales bacterium]